METPPPRRPATTASPPRVEITNEDHIPHMERTGYTLAHYLMETGQPCFRRGMEIIRDICGGLMCMHDIGTVKNRGALHRNIFEQFRWNGCPPEHGHVQPGAAGEQDVFQASAPRGLHIGHREDVVGRCGSNSSSGCDLQGSEDGIAGAVCRRGPKDPQEEAQGQHNLRGCKHCGEVHDAKPEKEKIHQKISPGVDPIFFYYYFFFQIEFPPILGG